MAWQSTGTSGLFAEPTNGGQGFKAWSASRTADGSGGTPPVGTGFFLGDATEAGAGFANLNSDDNSCFGMYGIGFVVPVTQAYSANAIRELAAPLMINGTFTFKLGINFRNGFKGVVLKNGTTDIFAFRAGALGGVDAYQTAVNGGGAGLGAYTDLGWAYGSNSVFTIAYNRTGTSSAQVLIRQTGNTNNVTTINVNSGPNSTAVDRAEWFVAGTTEGGPSNNLYFNSLSAYNEWRL